jgi:hypothetical protein
MPVYNEVRDRTAAVTETKEPRRIARCLIRPKERSTWFNLREADAR